MTKAEYSAELHRIAHDVWGGNLTPSRAASLMDQAVQDYLTSAWEYGARRCGVMPDELLDQERNALQGVIFRQMGYVGRYTRWLGRNRQSDGVKLSKVLSRADLWVQRWQHVIERAKEMACGNRKAVWVYGDTINHCRDCARVVGRVYRRSIWRKYGWRPGSADLACGGWRCDCRLEETDAAVTPGRPPSVRGAL